MEFRLPKGNSTDGPHCGVTALAVLAGTGFNEMWEYVGVGKPHNWLGSVTNVDIARALKHYKVRYRRRHYNKDISIRWFSEHYAKPGAVYLIDTMDHICLLLDGTILDQRGYFTLADKGHWHVEQVYAIR